MLPRPCHCCHCTPDRLLRPVFSEVRNLVGSLRSIHPASYSPGTNTGNCSGISVIAKLAKI